MFDWSVGLGNVITIVVLGIGGIGFLYTIKTQVINLSGRLQDLEHELHRLTDILVAQGRQDERMTAMDARLVAQGKRLDELAMRFNKKIDE